MSQAGESPTDSAGVHFEIICGSEQGTGHLEICCYDGSLSEADLESFCDSLEVPSSEHYWQTGNSIHVDMPSKSVSHICHRWHADDNLAECKQPCKLELQSDDMDPLSPVHVPVAQKFLQHHRIASS